MECIITGTTLCRGTVLLPWILNGAAASIAGVQISSGSSSSPCPMYMTMKAANTYSPSTCVVSSHSKQP